MIGYKICIQSVNYLPIESSPQCESLESFIDEPKENKRESQVHFPESKIY